MQVSDLAAIRNRQQNHIINGVNWLHSSSTMEAPPRKMTYESRLYFTDSPTPAKFAALIKSADDGDIGNYLRMNDEMESKDLHLQGVANTRRSALTALDYKIVPCDNVRPEDRQISEEAAHYVSEQLDSIEGFHDSLVHLSNAIGPNIAVTELLWNAERAELVGFNDIPGYRLCIDSNDQLTVENEPGIDDAVVRPGKYITYIPKIRAGFPLAVTIARAQVMPYVIKHFGVSDWAVFAEVFGQPIRLGKYNESTDTATKAELQTMLENMGSEAWAMHRDDVEIMLREINRGVEPYSKLIEWVERKQSIGYLGQTGTTETGSQGSYALVKVHDSVRADILMNDKRNEEAMVRRQVIKPMVMLKFPNHYVPLPKFRRKMIEPKNMESERLVLDRITLATNIGLPTNSEQMYELLDLQRPDDRSVSMQEILTSVEQSNSPEFLIAIGKFITNKLAGMGQTTTSVSDDDSAETPEIQAETSEEAATTITLNDLTLGMERLARAGDMQSVAALRKALFLLLGEDTNDIESEGSNNSRSDLLNKVQSILKGANL